MPFPSLNRRLRVLFLGGVSIYAISAGYAESALAGCSADAGGTIQCSGTSNSTIGFFDVFEAGADVTIRADSTTVVTTMGASAIGIIAESLGPKGSDGHDENDDPFDPHGASGGDAGHPSGNVDVRSEASVTTSGSGAVGIFGIARAGNGGDGGSGHLGGGKDGGTGGDNSDKSVTIESSGSIQTSGSGAIGIVGQNHGGIGGDSGGGGLFAGGGDGGDGGHAGSVDVTNDGSIATSGAHAFGVFLHSVGGFGGSGGSGAGFVGYGGTGGSAGNGGAVSATNAGIITTTGDYSNGIYVQSVGGGGGRGGNGVGVVGLGGVGGLGGDGNHVDVTNDAGDGNPASAKISTSGVDAIGIFAQSVGGSGGDGGDSAGLVSIGGSGAHGGAGGNVTVSNAGTIETTSRGAVAIHAQSVGGGGGHGGSSAGFASLGGSGDDGGDAGTVDVSNSTNAVLTTEGDDATAIFAQSVGGGGGDGGSSLGAGPAASIALGGSGAKGGHASTVTVIDCTTVSGGAACEAANNGEIATEGARSHGIHAQGVGGGGGRGGFSVALSGGPVAMSAAFGGSGAGGGDGSEVTVLSNSNITTQSDHSYGINAESVGGGGGHGGFAVAGAASDGPSFAAAMGGSAGVGGEGKKVKVAADGLIVTFGDVSHGIFGQSVGGGGGNGGFAVSGALSSSGAAVAAFGGHGGGGGDGGEVDVSASGDITTSGSLSNAIHAQSIGGGGGHGGFAIGAAATADAPSLTASLGGAGGDGGSAKTVSVSSSGRLNTLGEGSHAVFAQSVGGGGGSGGFSGSFSASFGDGANVGLSMGGSGGTAGHGRAVSVTTTKSVGTSGEHAVGILAQSVGGGGGHGGFGMKASMHTEGAPDVGVAIGGTGGGGGDGDDVDVEADGSVSTQGERAHGIHAQSVGGGGGAGGFALSGTLTTSSGQKSLSVAVGGSGGDASHGGEVSVTSKDTVKTVGARAIGVFIQSVGGGGGDGGLAVSGAFSGNESRNGEFSLGGSAGDGGDGEAVAAQLQNRIETSGQQAHGVLAQSIGGGGGTGGLAADFDLTNGGSNTQVNIGIGGSGGGGGKGGTVDVSAGGGVITHGYDAVGIFAQSVGGGGGNGGSVSTYGINTQSEAAGKDLQLGVAVGGTGGSGGIADAVTVVTGGQVTTAGDTSHGVVAQSIGGGGGRGGNANSFSLFTPGGGGSEADEDNNGDGKADGKKGNFTANVSIGGDGGSGNDGGSVDVTNLANVTTTGHDAMGIFAQSIGAGGGEGGHGSHSSGIPLPVIGGSVPPGLNKVGFLKKWDVSVGGSGGASGDGKAVTVTSGDRTTGVARSIATQGDGSMAVLAQSVGGGGGIGGYGAIGETGKIGIGGEGGAAGDGGIARLDLLGDVTTGGLAAHAVVAQSIGGGGGVAGNVRRGFMNTGVGVAFQRSGGGGGTGHKVQIDSKGTIATSGQAAFGVLAQSIGGGGGVLGDTGVGLPAVGFFGSVGKSGDASDVTVNHDGVVQTTGDYSTGIFAQSSSANTTGKVKVSVSDGGVATTGVSAVGIFAESLGTSGEVEVDLSADVATRGDDSTAVHAKTSGDVTVSHDGTVVTGGAASRGIFALSTSDNATGAVNVSLTGGGGVHTEGANSGGIHAESEGSNGVVSVSAVADLTTQGDSSTAVYAKTSGDVTISHQGLVQTKGASSSGLFAQSTADDPAGVVSVTLRGDGVRTTGDDSVGVHAENAGTTGGVVVNVTADIATEGADAIALLAKSSGGAAVDVDVEGMIVTEGAEAHALVAQSLVASGAARDVTVKSNGVIVTSGQGALGIQAQSQSTSGDAGAVSVEHEGGIQTTGDFATGIFAQSEGTGATETVKVTLSDGSVQTSGKQADGIFAESLGTGGDIDVDVSSDVMALGVDSSAFRLEGGSGTAINLDIDTRVVQGGSGDGFAVRIVGGGTNKVTSYGTLSALSGNAIQATTGDDTIENFGTIEGNIYLGSGSNAIFNRAGGLLHANRTINLGGGKLTNAGDISPGGNGTVGTTKVIGDFEQTASGQLFADVDFSNVASDRINVTGAVDLSGELVVNLQQLERNKPVTLVAAEGGARANGLRVKDTVVIDYEVVVDGGHVNLVADYDFESNALSPNQDSVAAYLNQALNAGISDELNPFFVTLATLTDPEEYDAAVATLNPESHMSDVNSFYEGVSYFADKVLSCPVHSGPNAPIAEGQCYWARATQRRMTQDETDSTVGYEQNTSEFAAGLQVAIAPNWRLGGALGYSTTTSTNKETFSSSGDTFSGGAVLKYTDGPWLFAGALTVGYTETEGERQINFPGAFMTAYSEADSAYLSGRIRGAYQFGDARFFIKPLVDFEITQLRNNGFEETGAGALSAYSESFDETLYTIRPAIQIGGTIGLGARQSVRPFVEVGVSLHPEKELILPVRLAGAPDDVAAFEVKTSIDTAVVGIATGLEMTSEEGVNFSLRYDTEFDEDHIAHSGSFKMSIDF
ncbi:MAG: hypothetical protein RIC14_08045 [Filomicrobium sp.]